MRLRVGQLADSDQCQGIFLRRPKTVSLGSGLREISKGLIETQRIRAGAKSSL